MTDATPTFLQPSAEQYTYSDEFKDRQLDGKWLGKSTATEVALKILTECDRLENAKGDFPKALLAAYQSITTESGKTVSLLRLAEKVHDLERDYKTCKFFNWTLGKSWNHKRPADGKVTNPFATQNHEFRQTLEKVQLVPVARRFRELLSLTLANFFNPKLPQSEWDSKNASFKMGRDETGRPKFYTSADMEEFVDHIFQIVAELDLLSDDLNEYQTAVKKAVEVRNAYREKVAQKNTKTANTVPGKKPTRETFDDESNVPLQKPTEETFVGKSARTEKKVSVRKITTQKSDDGWETVPTKKQHA